ncbi:TOMM precursor leader peptide-binding protein [Kitasatospora sp. LaBMicrA B282]|uniref:TOMM precursor leader peptide-binding protein n=1 Tax=Kitasatospora sp. LaBMicrA B282 TaxID=3420949 RepID=UPI003D0DADD7
MTQPHHQNTSPGPLQGPAPVRSKAPRSGPSQGPGSGPSQGPSRFPAQGRPPILAAARAALAGRLAERAATAGLPAPAVAALGDADLLGPQPLPQARERAAATVHLSGQAVLVGPWGGAGGAVRGVAAGAPGACGCCLAMRWQRLRSRTEREALETGLALTPVADGWPVLTGHAVDAVWALHRAVIGPDTPRSNPEDPARVSPASPLSHVSRLDLDTLRVQTVPLLPEPLCPACAAAGSTWPAGEGPVLPLRSRVKSAPDAYRLRPAADYPLPAAALANPVCGALGAGTWSDVTSPTTAPVAGSVFMRGYAGLTDVTWSGQANSFAGSRGLAFLEGLERYAGTHRRRTARPLTDSYRNLAGAALDPHDCGLYAEQTYRDDPMLSPFDPDRPIPWVPGWSLRDERPILVPARLCYYSAGTAADNFVFECSNGCAIGSCLEEAILFGLLELIERDAFLLGWYGNAALPELDLDALLDGGPAGESAAGGSPTAPTAPPAPALRAMIDRAALQGYRVRAFDNRVDLAVPVVTAVAVREDGGPGTLAFAAAAGFDPAATLESAVAEILTYIPHLPGQVSARPAELAAMAEDFDLVRRLPDHAALFGLPRMAEHARSYLAPAARSTPAEAYRSWAKERPQTLDLLDDLLFLRDQLVRAGFDVIVVDQTTPEQARLGLRTVCTLVPGLLPIDFGWARQRALQLPRLRTALYRGGLRSGVLTDADLRLVPHPFP